MSDRIRYPSISSMSATADRMAGRNVPEFTFEKIVQLVKRVSYVAHEFVRRELLHRMRGIRRGVSIQPFLARA